jgi:hypothetical protein
VLVAVLDEQFDLIEHLAAGRREAYTYADVLAARSASTSRATGAQDAGQLLEDLVAVVIQELGLTYEAQTRFTGVGGQTAPADFAIPAGFSETRIAIGVKGYGSTGSKITTTYDEVKGMANVRLPQQYVFVVADGIGWKRRRSDLDRILELNRQHQIAGVFPLDEFDDFRDALRHAAVVSGLVEP